MNTVECKELILSTLSRRGNGTEHSPIRIITEVFTKEGELIAEYDPAPETYTMTDIFHFIEWCKKEKISIEIIAKSTFHEWLTLTENKIS